VDFGNWRQFDEIFHVSLLENLGNKIEEKHSETLE
jgi:hypothetical protein